MFTQLPFGNPNIIHLTTSHCIVSFSISRKEDLMVMNCPSFCITENILISPSFLRIVLPDIEFLVESILFQHFISSHCFLSCKISAKKFSNNFIVYDKLFLSCSFQHSLFIFGFWQFDYKVFQCGFLVVYTTWNSFNFLDL